MQIHPSVHKITNSLIINKYLIVEAEQLTLIDTGLPGHGKSIIKYIHSINRVPEEITRILITHADGDHFGSINQLRINPNLIVCTSNIEADAIRAGKQSRPLKLESLFARLFNKFSRRFFKAPSAGVDQILHPDEVLPVLGGLRVLGTAGHTPGHLSFFSTSTGILFAGDSIVIRGKRAFPSSGFNTWDESLAFKSFDFQMALNPAIICAGHGSLVL
jgi:glyoxylase-like metal-dependent hydrolase (beta-lactamase superfamily II)